jgi:hypothetical protein
VWWLSPKAGVVVLEKIKKNLLPPTGKKTPFLGLSLFCLVTALTELSFLLQATTVLNHSECPSQPTSERVTTHCVINPILIDLEVVDTIRKITILF